MVDAPWHQKGWFKSMDEGLQSVLLEHSSLGEYINDVIEARLRDFNLAMTYRNKVNSIDAILTGDACDWDKLVAIANIIDRRGMG